MAAPPPLVAFNVELAPPARLEDARRIAAHLRTTLPAVKAIGLHLRQQDLVQVSTNIEDHTRTTPAQVVEAVRHHAPVQQAELVALTPQGVFDDFPADVPLKHYDPETKTIERLLDP